jgi:L-ascorbate metabolism protein UlaG (beta-lactamase superfamily)
VGVTEPWEIASRVPGAGEFLTGEMSPYEAALAARWLGLETVFPCHYCDPNHPDAARDLSEFHIALAEARKRGESTPESHVLKPGEWFEVK